MPKLRSTSRMNFGGRERAAERRLRRSLTPSGIAEAERLRLFGSLLEVTAEVARAAAAAAAGTTDAGPVLCFAAGVSGELSAADVLVESLAGTAAGIQRPSKKSWPDGQGAPHALSVRPRTRVNRTWSGLSMGRLALTWSVKAFIAMRLEVFHIPLMSPL